MSPSDEEIGARIVEVMGHPLADSGSHVMEKLREGYVWSVRKKNGVVISARFLVPTIWMGCLMALVTLCGCVNVTATKESIRVSSFLSTISNGNYTNGQGASLSVSSSTPDQQSISTLVGGVITLAKMYGDKNSATNTVSISTNSAGTIVVTPATPH